MPPPPSPPLQIKQVYDAKKGNFSELSMLDVQQIFGRAGRPQFDTSGEGIIITTHAKLAHYLGERQAGFAVRLCGGLGLQPWYMYCYLYRIYRVASILAHSTLPTH